MLCRSSSPPVACSLATNLVGRDFVVGDLSALGEFAGIGRAMVDQGFDHAHDRLFCVGHVGVDGSSAQEAKAMIRFLSQPHVFAVRGEREERLLALSERGAFGGPGDGAQGNLTGLQGLMRANRTTWFTAADAADRASILELLTAMPLAIQTGSESGAVSGYVHAQVPIGLSWPAFMRSLNDADGYAIDMALFGRIAADAPGAAACEAQPAAVAGAEAVFVGHAAATAHRGASSRPRNVHHVHSMQRAICPDGDQGERHSRAAAKTLGNRLQDLVITMMEPQRIAMR